MDSPDPLSIGTLILGLAGLAAIYSKINSAIRQMAGKGEGREITNNPLNTLNHSRPATMEDVKIIADRVAKLEKNQSINATAFQAATHENSTKIDDLRDRIDDKLENLTDKLGEISRAVGRLEGS